MNGAVDTVSDNKESGGKHVGEGAKGAAASPPFPEPVMEPCILDNCSKKFGIETDSEGRTDLDEHMFCDHIACVVCKKVFQDWTKLNNHRVKLHRLECYRPKRMYKGRG